MDSIIEKAVDLHTELVGDIGCIGDESCECFACELRRHAKSTECEIKEEIDRQVGEANKEFRDYCTRFLSTEIGNRLRCGCWDGVKMQKLFDDHFDEQMEKEMVARLRGECRDACRNHLKAFLEAVVRAVDGVHRSDELRENAEIRNAKHGTP